MPSVRIDKPDDPRFKLLGAMLAIDWRLGRSILVDVWSHMTDAQSWVLRAEIIDAIAGMPGFHSGLLCSDLAVLEPDGLVRILEENAPFGAIEWLGDHRAARSLGGKRRAAGAKRDSSGRMAAPSEPSEPAGDQLPSSSTPADIQLATSCTPADIQLGIQLNQLLKSKVKVKDSLKANSGEKTSDDAFGAQSELPKAGEKPSKKRRRAVKRQYPPELEAVYAEYPRRERKTQGMALLERDLTAEEYPLFRNRVRAYVAMMRSKGKLEYLLNWKNLALEWRELGDVSSPEPPSGESAFRYTFEDDDGTGDSVDV